MKFFDAGDHATGFIAVGQHATGFFALGQMATGVIAIGQVARGGIAIGQLAVGLVGWGQLGIGVFHAVGMIGIGGRGIGGVLPLVPSIGRPRVMPKAVPFAAVEAGNDGWVEVDLAQDAGGLGLYLSGQRLPAKLDRRLQRRAYEITSDGPRRVHAYFHRVGPLVVCERIAHEPPRPYQKKSFVPLAALQLVGLLVLGGAYAVAAGHDVAVVIGNVIGLSDESPAPKKSTPPRTSPRRR